MSDRHLLFGRRIEATTCLRILSATTTNTGTANSFGPFSRNNDDDDDGVHVMGQLSKARLG